MAEDHRYQEIVNRIVDLRIDVGALQTDLSYIKTGMTDLREQVKRNAEAANAESMKTRDLFVSGRAVKYMVGLFFALVGGLYAARETLREIIHSWLIK